MLEYIFLLVVKVLFGLLSYFTSPKKLPKYVKLDSNTITDRVKNTPTYKSMYYVVDGYQPIVMIADFGTAKKLYQSNEYKSIIRTYPYLGYVMERLLKHSIGAHHGKEWLEMKKTLTKFFTTQSVKNNFLMIVEKTTNWTNIFFNKDTNEYSLQNLQLDILTIRIMSFIIYGPLSENKIAQLHELFVLHNKMMTIMGTDVLLRVPVFNNYVSTDNKKSVDSFWDSWCKFNDNIALNNMSTLFNTMIADSRYANNKLEFYQTLYEIMLFNLDIMVDAFANLIWNISMSQDIKEKVYNEITKIIPDIKNLSIEQINELSYLQCVINESARLNPGIVSTFAETLSEDIILNNYTLPKGTMISLDTQMINRDPNIWANPDKFDPSRFECSTNGVFSYHRFGLSPRKCMGNVFADYILKIGIIMLISTNDIICSNEQLVIEERSTIPNLSGYDMMNKITFIKRH